MQPRVKKLITSSLIFGALIVAIFIAYTFYLNLHFRVVSTDPKTNNVAASSPFFKVNFNRQLSSRNLSLTSNPSIISSYTISSKSLDIKLNYPLNISQTYTITIKSVADTKNEYLYNKIFSFTPKNVAYSDLSQAQQQAQLQNQTVHPPSKTNINFIGLDNLLNYGVTTAQLNSLEQDIFSFAPKASTASVSSDSIKPIPHDPNGSSTSDSINFDLKIDSTTYSSKIYYSNLTILRLYLYDKITNALVYDSK